MNLRVLSDDQLHQCTVQTAKDERAITLKLLKHLNEVEYRHLFSKFNCSSLHAYCVTQLKMSDPQAGRRVSASRLLKELPVIEEKIMNGSMSLTSVSQAAVFFNHEARSGNQFRTHEKADVLTELESKSTRAVSEILVSKSMNPEIHSRESVRPVTGELYELKTYIDHETLKDLERLKEIWSHAAPGATFADLIKRATKECLERVDPIKKAERSVRRREMNDARFSEARNQSESVPENQSGVKQDHLDQAGLKQLGPKQFRPVSYSFIRHQIRLRDQGQCTFVDPRTNERCESRHFLEEDHIVPKAMGGEYSVENIRLRCRAHNQRHAIESYGFEKMQPFLKR